MLHDHHKGAHGKRVRHGVVCGTLGQEIMRIATLVELRCELVKKKGSQSHYLWAGSSSGEFLGRVLLASSAGLNGLASELPLPSMSSIEDAAEITAVFHIVLLRVCTQRNHCLPRTLEGPLSFLL